MKKLIGIMGILVLFSVSSVVVAGDDHKKEAKEITGEVIDMFCYLDHGASGDGHAKCAVKCIKSGIPVGLKTADGALYLAVGADHKAANDMLGEYGGKTITVKGTTSEKDGVKLLAISEIVKK